MDKDQGDRFSRALQDRASAALETIIPEEGLQALQDCALLCFVFGQHSSAKKFLRFSEELFFRLRSFNMSNDDVRKTREIFISGSTAPKRRLQAGRDLVSLLHALNLQRWAAQAAIAAGELLCELHGLSCEAANQRRHDALREEKECEGVVDSCEIIPFPTKD